MSQDLATAQRLCVEAGAILLEHFASPIVGWKGPGDPVTEADRLASALIVRELQRIFPDDGILSEEEADDASRLSKRRVWIVDPLDGTTEFIHHIDEFATMIGLSVDGVATVGAVYQPTRDKLYFAEAGGGAFLRERTQERKLRVSGESNPAAMTIALSRSHPSSRVEELRGKLGVGAALLMGSIGLKVGLICEGLAHLYVQPSSHTSQWDACAPDIILSEAGGRMTDLRNAPLRYNGPDVRNLNGVIASNGTIHEKVCAALLP